MTLKQLFGKVCRNKMHNHIMARHNRVIINHYLTGRHVTRYTTCTKNGKVQKLK